MSSIIGMWREKFFLGSLRRNRIEDAVSQMGLDE